MGARFPTWSPCVPAQMIVLERLKQAVDASKQAGGGLPAVVPHLQQQQPQPQAGLQRGMPAGQGDGSAVPGAAAAFPPAPASPTTPPAAPAWKQLLVALRQAGAGTTASARPLLPGALQLPAGTAGVVQGQVGSGSQLQPTGTPTRHVAGTHGQQQVLPGPWLAMPSQQGSQWAQAPIEQQVLPSLQLATPSQQSSQCALAPIQKQVLLATPSQQGSQCALTPMAHPPGGAPSQQQAASWQRAGASWAGMVQPQGQMQSLQACSLRGSAARPADLIVVGSELVQAHPGSQHSQGELRSLPASTASASSAGTTFPPAPHHDPQSAQSPSAGNNTFPPAYHHPQGVQPPSAGTSFPPAYHHPSPSALSGPQHSVSPCCLHSHVALHWTDLLESLSQD